MIPYDEIREWRPDIDDHDCITLATLHGATFKQIQSIGSGGGLQWLVWLEGAEGDAPRPIREKGGAGGVTRGDACRRYVKRHNLLR